VHIDAQVALDVDDALSTFSAARATAGCRRGWWRRVDPKGRAAAGRKPGKDERDGHDARGSEAKPTGRQTKHECILPGPLSSSDRRLGSVESRPRDGCERVERGTGPSDHQA
jgi:hypothetical protein